MYSKIICSLCKSAKLKQIISLGRSPVANTFYSKKNFKTNIFPLNVDFCKNCLNLQLEHCLSSTQLFRHYSYTTPNSIALNKHYSKLINLLFKKKFFKKNKTLIEIGSNNGIFLNFIKKFSNKICGVDPAKNIIAKNKFKNIKIFNDFFSKNLAKKILKKNEKFDLAIARHVIAHNHDPYKIVEGVPLILKSKGIFVVENAYSLETIKKNQFDQIYHEHMFYFSLTSFAEILKKIDFAIIDYEMMPIHGGSIVMFCAKKNDFKVKKKVFAQQLKEKLFLNNNLNLVKFKKTILSNKQKLNLFIKKNKNKIFAAYGAPAKAFTSFAFFGLNNKIIKFCIDNSENKKGKYFAFFDIPVFGEKFLKKFEYDIIIVNSWNYKDEILKKASKIFKKGTILIFLIPFFYVYKVK